MKQYKIFIILVLLLAVSWNLRAVLVLQGGQKYWPDERLHRRSIVFFRYLSNSESGKALDLLLTGCLHNGFTVVGCLGESVRSAILLLPGLPPETVKFFKNSVVFGALFLATASVACIGLTYAVARKAGARKSEGLIAAFLMACSNSMFYYSRHLLAYDSGMALALLALWIGLDTRPGVWRSAVCGMVASMAFLTYNGYWIIVLVVLAIHFLRGEWSPLKVVKRFVAMGLGFVLLPGLLCVAGFARGVNFIARMQRYDGSAYQGVYAEGWSLPWEYLWHAEHGLLLVWIGGAVAVVWLSVRHYSPACKRGLLWLAVTMGLYLFFAFDTTIFRHFILNGRRSRQLIPFLCLTAAFGWANLGNGWWLKRGRWVVGATVLVVLAGLNFAQPLMQKFPADVMRQVKATYGPVANDLTILRRGSDRNLMDQSKTSRYILLNANYYFYPVIGSKAPPPGRVVFRTAHPLQFLPYQYEGYKPAERSIIRSTDISMRLIDTQSENQGGGNKP